MKTLGILGGGQLGRMSALAAAHLGIRTVIFTPEENSPASCVTDHTFVADYTDKDALRAFAAKVDVISYEFENIPIETVRYLKTLKPVYPEENLLEVAQDRIAEKSYLNAIGIPTARWSGVASAQEIRAQLELWGTDECIIKTTRFGYDGKGQARITSNTDIETVWSEFKNTAMIMEEIVSFEHELSVIVARDNMGHTQIYGPMRNEHKNHILDQTFIPSGLPDNIETRACDLGKKLAEKLNLRGVLTLELFVTKDGTLLANEIAPRTHNSGHYSIDACAVSQFENHVRTVSGLPAGSAKRHSDAKMVNLIGDDISQIKTALMIEGACIHDYGKNEVRDGRKMGHITYLSPKT